MLRWLAPRLPPRSHRLNFDSLDLDGGRSTVRFTNFGDIFHISKHQQHDQNDVNSQAGEWPSAFTVHNSLPPAPATNSLEPNSSLCPPYHIHLNEDETFHVLSGSAKFIVLKDGTSPRKQHKQHDSTAASSSEPSQSNGVRTHVLGPGSRITIPRGQIHTFRNASTTSRLELQFGFSSPPATLSTTETVHTLTSKMRTFFLNTQLYRSDCALHNLPRSLPQILLFNHEADIALVPSWLARFHAGVPFLRGFVVQFVAPVLGKIMNLLGGVVLGKWLFGYRSSYDEYMRPAGIDMMIRQADTRIQGLEEELSNIQKNKAEGPEEVKKVLPIKSQ